MMSLLLIRADADSQRGAGHVMRCLALAQAWQDQMGDVVYVCAALPESLEARLKTSGIDVVRIAETSGSSGDLQATLQQIAQLRPAWVVLDGYGFDAAYQRSIAQQCPNLLWMDDYGQVDHYTAAIVLNQNLDASPDLYEGRLSPHTRVLAGSDYAMLRREFLDTPRPQRPIAPPARLLVTLGGSDPNNHSSTILKGLCAALGPEHHVTLIASSRHAHLSSLRTMLEQASFKGTLACDVTDMASLMAQADLALSAAGSTCWELAYMKLPSLLVSVADNQVPLAQAMARHNAAINLGSADALDTDRLASALRPLLTDATRCNAMSQGAGQLVDGRGVLRVLAAMTGAALSLRPVTMEDAQLLLSWRNDPATQAASFNTQAVDLASHLQWLQRKLASPDALMFIACDQTGQPVGQIRLDIENGDALIDFTIAPAMRGQKLASRLLRLGCLPVLRRQIVRRMVGYVRSENVASQRAFLRAGFESMGEELVHQQPSIRFELR